LTDGLVMPYIPEQGDIIILDFNPQAGHEQKANRPALVVSNKTFNRRLLKQQALFAARFPQNTTNSPFLFVCFPIIGIDIILLGI